MREREKEKKRGKERKRDELVRENQMEKKIAKYTVDLSTHTNPHRIIAPSKLTKMTNCKIHEFWTIKLGFSRLKIMSNITFFVHLDIFKVVNNSLFY